MRERLLDPDETSNFRFTSDHLGLDLEASLVYLVAVLANEFRTLLARDNLQLCARIKARDFLSRERDESSSSASGF